MSGTARVALATCAAFPDGDADDAGLPAAIGGDVTFAVWDDPAVDWAAFDLVVVRSTWDYQERHDAFLAWAHGIGERLVNPPGVLAWNTDKRYLQELAFAGLPVVPTALVEPGATFTPAAVRVRRQADGQRRVARHGALHAHDEGDARRRARRRDPRIGPHRDGPALRRLGRRARRDRAAVLRRRVLARDPQGPAAGARRRADDRRLRGRAHPAARGDRGRARGGQQIVDWATERLGVDALTYARVDVVEDAGGAPILLELELTEPSLFFAGDAARLARFAAAVRRRLVPG